MAAKRKSDLDRIVDFFLNGSQEETTAAYATITAIQKAKAPKEATKTRKPSSGGKRKGNGEAAATGTSGAPSNS